MPPVVVQLLGPDHPALGAVTAVDVDAGMGLALSAGARPKPYEPVDVNEDAVVGLAGAVWVLAVADGHGGFDAAAAALGAVTEGAALLEPGGVQLLREAVMLLLERARAAIGPALADVGAERSASRTALTVAVGSGTATVVGWAGDTVAVRVDGRRRARSLAKPRDFLGPWTQPGPPVAVKLRRGERLVLASDGLVDALGSRWAQTAAALCAGLPGPQAARRLVEAALERGAEDNVAVGVGPPAGA